MNDDDKPQAPDDGIIVLPREWGRTRATRRVLAFVLLVIALGIGYWLGRRRPPEPAPPDHGTPPPGNVSTGRPPVPPGKWHRPTWSHEAGAGPTDPNESRVTPDKDTPATPDVPWSQEGGANAPETGHDLDAGKGGERRVSGVRVQNVRTLVDGGQAVDWSWQDGTFVVDKMMKNRYFSVYTYAFPAQGRLRILSLTLGMSGGEKLHRGCPSWFPTGEYAVFVSQNPDSESYRLSLPFSGLNCSLWLTDREGERYWKLSGIETAYAQPRGATWPVFSPDGMRLAWCGNTGKYPPDSVLGERALYVAEFFLVQGEPQVRETKFLQPGKRRDFYETHGFSPDGKRLLFSANPGADQPVSGMDICTLDLETNELTNLTNTPDKWDEFAAYSPDGTKIVWGSSRGQDLRPTESDPIHWQAWLRTEVWIMDADGSNARQLTQFNRSRAPGYGGRRCVVGDMAWNAAGDELAVVLHSETEDHSLRSRIMVLTLGRE